MKYEGIRSKIFRLLSNIFAFIKRKIEDEFDLEGVVTCELFDLQGNLVEKKVYHNLVTTVVKNSFAGLIGGETGFTGIVNYGAIGTNSASPAISDTQLGTEVARATIESGSYSRAGNVITMAFYFDPNTGNGSLKEFGAFVDATATTNSGTLFDRVNIDVTKTSLNSLRITLQITVS